jgi:hypothetical protein
MSASLRDQLIGAWKLVYNVDEQQQTLTHSMSISLFPNWIGQTQPRVVKIDGDFLYLSTASPIQSQGKAVNSYLQWKRAA